jgi:tetratricopeptide (TPR) repeat protein
LPSLVIGSYRSKLFRPVIAACICLLCIDGTLSARATGVQVWRGKLTIPTYSLNPADPNPAFSLINSNNVYPYAMLDDLADDKESRTYDALYLENPYLKVIILPQLGGHVYSLYDKVNQREVLYRNHVVKYGLVGPRGAWISGGIEFSFPFAHTMNTVSPVESTIRHNSDGSATVIVGAIDWVSNMYSEIALTLGPDSAELQEDVTLFNATSQANLHLFWSNAAVKASNDLHYVYPMRETIDDDPFAIVGAWPVSGGVDKSWYKNDSKAMAIFGRDVHRDFFGAYYDDSDAGVVHVADFRQDPGKKIWTWGTARSGRIWDKLLSDDDGPYNEIQSGRFSTQGFREFMQPRLIEKWTEYWYPVGGLGNGFVDATREAALNVSYSTENSSQATATVRLSPALETSGATVVIKQGNAILKVIRRAHLLPLHTEVYSVPVPDVATAKQKLEVEIKSADGQLLMHWLAGEPIDGNPEFVSRQGTRLESEIPDSAQTPTQALYLRGVFLEKVGNMKGALKVYDEVLQRDPEYIPALLREGWYHYQAGSFDQAEHLITRAVNRDGTSYEAEYALGVVERAEGRLDSAMDALWAATHYGGETAAALVEIGELEVRQHNYPKAVELLNRAVAIGPEDALAFADLSVAERLSGNSKDALAAAEHATALMPLLPYALAERFEDEQALQATAQGKREDGKGWQQIIGSDPQNYLAIAAWYHSLGAWQSADVVLKAAVADPSTSPISPLINYYLASDARQEGDAQAAAQFAGKAATASSAAVFPNRLEDSAVLQEALQSDPSDPQAKYELGNFLFAHERFEEAASLWRKAIAEGFNNSVILRNMGEFEGHITHELPKAAVDYRHALSLRPTDYRLFADLDEIYEEENNMAARKELFEKAPQSVFERDTIRARHIIFLMETDQYQQALKELESHNFKPWEGGVSFHNLYVSADMARGRQELADHRASQAEQFFRDAMLYPENLGTGAPDTAATSEQRYWLGNVFEAENMQEKANAEWENSSKQGSVKSASCQVYVALSLRKLGKPDVAKEMLQQCIRNAEQPNASAAALVHAGLAEEYSENAAAARADFYKALTVDPLYWRARIALATME